MKATDIRWVREGEYGDYEFTVCPPDLHPEEPEDSKWEWWVSYIPRFSKIVVRGYADSKQEALDNIQKWCEENLADY